MEMIRPPTPDPDVDKHEREAVCSALEECERRLRPYEARVYAGQQNGHKRRDVSR